jgi:hypothetical protein
MDKQSSRGESHRVSWRLCRFPVSAELTVPAVTCAVTVQVPMAMNETLRPLVVQVVDEVTDFVPSPVVATWAVKFLPTAAVVGRLVILGVVGVVVAPEVTGDDTDTRSAARPTMKN